MSSRPSAFTLTQPGRMRLYSTRELVAMPPPEWHIDGLFPQGGFVVVYGPPGCGKSFIAADMCCAIGAGREWHGRTAEPGHALYVAAEGGSGMGKRIAGWAAYHDVDPAHVDISWLLESFPVQADSEDMVRLLDRLVEIDTVPSLIVIDTLARNYVGDENKQEDMNAFIAGVDHLRHELKATVLIVHHTRLDGDRERGNTALRGAADSMFAIHAKKIGDDRHITLVNDKQKDAEEAKAFRVVLTPDHEHDTLVVREFQRTKRTLTPATLKFVALVEPLGAGATWTFNEIKALTGLHPQAITRAIEDLKTHKMLVQQGRDYSLVKMTLCD